MEDKIKNLKKELIGKQLKSIIYLNIDDELRRWINKKIDNEYYNIDMAQLLVFEDRFLLFIDLDCDGYRSGDWYIKDFKKFASKFLDKGHTKEIKHINSKITELEYYESAKSIVDSSSNDSNFLMIVTDEYVIEMGQSDVSDYYPSNFFSVEQVKELILQKNYSRKSTHN